MYVCTYVCMHTCLGFLNVVILCEMIGKLCNIRECGSTYYVRTYVHTYGWYYFLCVYLYTYI